MFLGLAMAGRVSDKPDRESAAELLRLPRGAIPAAKLFHVELFGPPADAISVSK